MVETATRQRGRPARDARSVEETRDVILQAALTPFGEIFQEAFHMQGVVPNNEAIVAMGLEQFGTYTALIMLLSMEVAATLLLLGAQVIAEYERIGQSE